MKVDPVLVSFLKAAHSHKKPIGAICISPIILASVFGSMGVRLTLGDVDCGPAKAAKAMGASIEPCTVDRCVVDDRLWIVTTPAYMLEAGIGDVAKGIRSLAREVIRLSNESNKT